jgi:hypothetical protein
MIGPWGRPRGIRVAPRNVDEIRAFARRARVALGIFSHPIDMVELLENRLRKIAIHFHIVEDALIPREAARAIPEQGLILLTEEAYNGIHEGDPQYELLVPHELGHFALRHVATFARAMSSVPHSVFEDSEVQADQFSHELVMPAALVQRHCQSTRAIQQVFNIPGKDAEIRHIILRAEGLIHW